MSKATVTVRELKNRDSGIDVLITGCKEEMSMLSVKLEYRVLVISNLSCFKSHNHQPQDVVQFVINRTEDQFLELHKALGSKFSLADLPSITSSTRLSLFKEVDVRKQKEELEAFIKMVVSTPMLATSYLTLEFLGVNPVVAGNYNRIRDEAPVSNRGNSEHDIFEEEVEGEDLFTTSQTTAPSDDSHLHADLFQDIRSAKYTSTKIFDDQDYGGGESEDISELLLPGTLITSPKRTEEDNSHLFQIDDDLDKLLHIGKKKPESNVNNNSKTGEKPTKPSVKPIKPSQKPAKPNVPGGKPSLAPKPTGKPSLPTKPKLGANRKQQTASQGEGQTEVNNKTEDLGADDILKYIEQQSEKQTQQVDLFS